MPATGTGQGRKGQLAWCQRPLGKAMLFGVRAERAAMCLAFWLLAAQCLAFFLPQTVPHACGRAGNFMNLSARKLPLQGQSVCCIASACARLLYKVTAACNHRRAVTPNSLRRLQPGHVAHQGKSEIGDLGCWMQFVLHSAWATLRHVHAARCESQCGCQAHQAVHLLAARDQPG